MTAPGVKGDTLLAQRVITCATSMVFLLYVVAASTNTLLLVSVLKID